MRMTIIEGVEDNIRINLGSDVMLVASVMEVGKAKDYLVYEARLTGEEVLQLMRKTRNPGILDGDIVKDHHYILTAFDD